MEHNAQSKGKRESKSPLVMFALVQLVLLPMIAIAAWKGDDGTSALHLQPTLNRTARTVAPLHDYPLVISDDQLRSVLTRLRPPRRSDRPSINHIDHALRFWGADAAFEDAGVINGKQMMSVLIDDTAFRKVCGPSERPLLFPTSDGLRFRTQEGSATSSHVDHSLATLAEVGLPLDQTVRLRQDDTIQEVPFAALVVDAAKRFGINQQEYEWTSLVLAIYGRDFEPWLSGGGETITMDRIAERIMRQDYGQGCCYGGHRLFTLTALLRIDEEQRYFTESVRQQVIAHLAEATCRLVESQSPEGFWGNDWPGQRIGVDDKLSIHGTRLLSTGHALEWWAIAPESLHPPRECIVRAAQWLVAEIEKMDEETIKDNYTFLTHCGRALALWRGDDTARLWQRLGVAK